MNDSHIDAFSRALTPVQSRRGFVRLLQALALAGPPALFGAVAAGAKKKRKHKRCAHAGQTTSTHRKQCCKGLVKDGRDRCVAACTPTSCALNACGTVPDGCGGTLSCGGCAEHSLCLGGVCQPCHVCRSGCFFRTVQDAVDAAAPGDTVRICPGLYRGELTLDQHVTVIGAGAGLGDTILQGPGTSSVVVVKAGANVSLQRLRITGGGGIGAGGGIRNYGTLALTDCTITGNMAGAVGGGLLNSGILTLDAVSRVTGNVADEAEPDSGGGIFNTTAGTVTLSTAANVTGNTPDNCGGTPVSLCVDP